MVRPYATGDESGIVALFHRAFGAGDGRLPRRDVGWWRWEFTGGARQPHVMLAVDADSGAIVAQYAAVCLRFWAEGKEDLVTQPVDSMVDPDWRGTGAFLATARRYFDVLGNARHCLASYGFPNQRALRIGRRQLGYVPAFLPVPTLFTNLFAAGGWRALAASRPPLRIAEVRRYGPEVDALWLRNRAAFDFAVVRDAAYLNWRFADAPVPYRLFLVDGADGTPRAAFVLRERWCADTILALADYLAAPDDEAALHAALAFTVREAVRRGFGRVETWLPASSRAYATARRLGLDCEPSPLGMVARFYRAPPIQWCLDHWYYTIGDSDVH